MLNLNRFKFKKKPKKVLNNTCNSDIIILKTLLADQYEEKVEGMHGLYLENINCFKKYQGYFWHVILLKYI